MPGSELAGLYGDIERKYSSNQPRMPAGNSDGGQWTSEGSGGGNSPRPGIQVAQNESRRYGVDLTREELRGGHTLRDHVGKTDQQLMAVMRNDRGSAGIYGYVRQRQGTFKSVESANDLINRTLGQNKPAVDEVASGIRNDAFVTSRFGFITGREAYRPSPDAAPYLRNTYGVGVLIRHDPSASYGYRVSTAYPRND